MMPKRRNTRAHTTAKAIAAERRQIDELVAERNKPPPLGYLGDGEQLPLAGHAFELVSSAVFEFDS